jgi:hypothetical protein
LLIEFAQKARDRGGLRLLKRMHRHAKDTKTRPLDNGAKGSVVSYNGKVGLVIEHSMQPSYRNELYRVKVALTRESLLSCFCDCKAGAELDARHACVHMAPTIYLLNLFLFDGLADNLLYELSARWKAADDDSLSATEQNDMVQAVRTLIAASGVTVKDVPMNSREASVDKMLAFFNVGTEKAKRPPPPPLPSTLYDRSASTSWSRQ